MLTHRPSERRPETEQADPELEGERRAQGPADWLLALQQTAGNAGTARLVSRHAAAGRRRVSREISGNPGDLPPVPGGATGTTHAAPGIQDAVNHKAPQTGGRSQTMSVRLKATADSPVLADTVTEAQLFERQDLPLESDAAAPPQASVASLPGGFTTVNEVSGAVDAPIVHESADESIFIDPGPTADDVQQGGIGDCWDMATFIGIVNRDPGRIRSMMTPDATGGASVTFYYKQALPFQLAMMGMPTSMYLPDTVSVSNELAFNRSAESVAGTKPATDRALASLSNGQPYGRQIHGAQLRAAPTPKVSKWFCVINGDTLEIHRLEIFQMARWAPLLEKAAARFTEIHGQYGKGGDASEGEKALGVGKGYSNLDGGYPGYTLTMFYGAEGQYTAGGQGDDSATAWSPATAGTSAVLLANAAPFERLLTLAGRDASYKEGDTDAPVVTARAWGDAAGDAVYIPRLQAAIFAAVADPDWANLTPQAQTELIAVQTAILAWVIAVPDPTPMPSPPAAPPPNCKTVTKQALVAAARLAADPARNPTLVDKTRSEPIKAMLDELLIVKNMPVDWSQGSRSVYAGHEYSVLSLELVNTPLAPPGFQLQNMAAMTHPAFYQFIDVNASNVTLMNPHHANEPDPSGKAASTGGVFKVTLDRFFRLYAAVMSADFKIPAS